MTGDKTRSPRRSATRAAIRLLPPEAEELSIDGENLGNGGLVGLAAADQRTQQRDPCGGDPLDVLLAVDREGQGPEGVALTVSTMARGLSAAPVGQGQGTGQEAVWDPVLMDELVFALPQPGGLIALGRKPSRLSPVHHTEVPQN